MRSTTILSAASLWSLAFAATSTIVSIPTPTATPLLNAMTSQGCYKSGEPLEDHGSYVFQSPGNCQPICVLLQKPVMGLVDGSNCWCGDLLPALSDKVDNGNCDTPCNGYDKVNCGGPSFWAISLTGLNKNKVQNYDPASSSTEASKTATPVVTVGGSTVVVTASDIPTSTSKSKKTSSEPNKAAIAAGVVVGVVGLAAIIAGVVFFLKQKRRREVEEEYRRQAAVSSFVGAGKLHTSNSSMNDSRLDPEVMLRRQSDGSIADNQDYSRRILKVTNPDGH